jgi:hypothetical protein
MPFSTIRLDQWTQNIAVSIQEPTQVASCCNMLAPVRQLSSNSRSDMCLFSQVQRVFNVEHYLASRSYLMRMSLGVNFPILLCQTNRQYLVWRTVSGHYINCSLGWFKHKERSDCLHHWMRWTFPKLNITLFLYSDFNVIYFLTNKTCVKNGLRDFRIILKNHSTIWFKISVCSSYQEQLEMDTEICGMWYSKENLSVKDTQSSNEQNVIVSIIINIIIVLFVFYWRG